MADFRKSILWRRLDVEGHDACLLAQTKEGWELHGQAVCREDQITKALVYRVWHDYDWTTRRAVVSGWCGYEYVDVTLSRDGPGNWRYNGTTVNDVQGAKDVDLGFTPATNTSAIRRLDLDVRQSSSGIAAWLDPRDWQLKPLEQSYLRKTPSSYVYCSPGHDYRCELSVDEFGLVMLYPKIWQRV